LTKISTDRDADTCGGDVAMSVTVTVTVYTQEEEDDA